MWSSNFSSVFTLDPWRERKPNLRLPCACVCRRPSEPEWRRPAESSGLPKQRGNPHCLRHDDPELLHQHLRDAEHRLLPMADDAHPLTLLQLFDTALVRFWPWQEIIFFVLSFLVTELPFFIFCYCLTVADVDVCFFLGNVNNLTYLLCNTDI